MAAEIRSSRHTRRKFPLRLVLVSYGQNITRERRLNFTCVDGKWGGGNNMENILYGKEKKDLASAG